MTYNQVFDKGGRRLQLCVVYTYHLARLHDQRSPKRELGLTACLRDINTNLASFAVLTLAASAGPISYAVACMAMCFLRSYPRLPGCQAVAAPWYAATVWMSRITKSRVPPAVHACNTATGLARKPVPPHYILFPTQQAIGEHFVCPSTSTMSDVRSRQFRDSGFIERDCWWSPTRDKANAGSG